MIESIYGVIVMFCIFLNVRYSNPKLMHIGHQYVAANFDPTVINGLLEMKAYHISPDKGVGIFTFKNQNNLEKHLPGMKSFFKDYEDRFSCKCTIETGITNEELFYQADLK